MAALSPATTIGRSIRIGFATISAISASSSKFAVLQAKLGVAAARLFADDVSRLEPELLEDGFELGR